MKTMNMILQHDVTFSLNVKMELHFYFISRQSKNRMDGTVEFQRTFFKYKVLVT